MGHTTTNCKINIENKLENDPLPNSNSTDTPENIIEEHSELIENISPHTNLTLDLQLDQTKTNWSDETEALSQTFIKF